MGNYENQESSVESTVLMLVTDRKDQIKVIPQY